MGRIGKEKELDDDVSGGDVSGDGIVDGGDDNDDNND